MILHTLNASPATAAFADCLQLLQTGDALLLLGDGVYAALPGTAALDTLLALQSETAAELYILAEDARAAGIGAVDAAIQTVDTDGFVALTERFPLQQAWY